MLEAEDLPAADLDAENTRSLLHKLVNSLISNDKAYGLAAFAASGKQNVLAAFAASGTAHLSLYCLGASDTATPCQLIHGMKLAQLGPPLFCR